MKLSKGILALVTATMALSGVASAQTVEAKKTAIQTINPEFYGLIQLRQKTFRTVEKDGSYVDDRSQLQIRPTLGAALFDGKVDTAFTLLFRKGTNDQRISRNYLFNETFWTLHEQKMGAGDAKLQTYSYFEQNTEKESAFGLQAHGVYVEANYPVETTIGKLKFSAFTNPTAEFISNKRLDSDKLPVTNRSNRDSLSLTDDEKTVKRRDPAYNNDTEVSAKLNPAALSKLSTTLAVEYIQRWDPKYVTASDDATQTKVDGYATKGVVLNKIAVGYAISDAVSISNSLRYHVGGLYNSGIREEAGHVDPIAVGNASWENRVVLTATLF